MKSAGCDRGRRQFLVLGAAGAAMGPVPFVWGSEGRTGRFTGEAASSEEIDSRASAVGYWTGSEECADLAGFLAGVEAPVNRNGREAIGVAGERRPFRAGIIAAEALSAGDPGFLRTGAYVTIHGLSMARRSVLRPKLGGLSVQIPFRFTDRGVPRTATCPAWNYSRAPVTNRSAAAGMLVPVERESGLRFFVEEHATEPGLVGRAFEAVAFGKSAGENGPALGRRDEVRFTTGREAGVPRLRRGIYVVALRGHRGWNRPAWRHFRLLDTPGEEQPRGLLRQGPLGPEPADFDYLLVSIEAGRPAVAVPPEA